MKKKDILLISLILAVSLLLLLVLRLNSEDGDAVEIRIDSKIVAEYSLHVDATYTLNGGTNILVIEDGYAYLTYADCPDHLCVNQGRVNKTGAVITCLPNKLTITVIGKKTDVDLVS